MRQTHASLFAWAAAPTWRGSFMSFTTLGRHLRELDRSAPLSFIQKTPRRVYVKALYSSILVG